MMIYTFPSQHLQTKDMKKIAAFIFGMLVLTNYSCGDKNDDNPPAADLPKISISSVTVFEGDENSTVNFIVTTSKEYAGEVKVDYATQEETAGEGTDFLPVAGTLTIDAGEREGFIAVEIIGDIFKEQDEEFKVILSNPVNATISNGEGLGTIRNEDTFVDVPEDGYITPDSYAGYDLVWRDEFNGSTLNTNDWTYELGASGWGNNEWQYYTDREDNAYLSDGNLIIEAKEEEFQGSNYTSARLITKDKKTFTFGRVDIRAILPEGQGIWPALWMLGNNISSVGWPACGEIDIMELVGHEPSTVHGTVHTGPQGQSWSNYIGQGYTLSSGKFSDEYHVFSIIWEYNSIKFFVDDNQYFSITDADISNAYPYPFNDEFFFIFNIAVGGNWPGYPDATTQFPQRMIVDYIRVFQEN
jgi:beta-glucanase (GH16 family)